MLDIPKIGLAKLNSALSHIASVEEDPAEYEAAESCVEALRLLVGRTKVRQGLKALSVSMDDQLRREKDVQRSLTEASDVRRMS